MILRLPPLSHVWAPAAGDKARGKGPTAELPEPSEGAVWLLYVWVGLLIAEAFLVTSGYGPHLAPWLLALLAVGVGQALLLPPVAGWIGGLATLTAWVLLQQAAGVWRPASWVQSLVALAGLAASIALAVQFRKLWERDRRELSQLRALRCQIAIEDAVPGLLTTSVGLLRLREEAERAAAFGRPLGLLLIEPSPKAQFSKVEADTVYRALARQLTGAISVHDTPFAADTHRLGVILPERGGEALARDVARILERLRDASLVDGQGRARPLSGETCLMAGLSVFDGEGHVRDTDLMQVAEELLSNGGQEGDRECWPMWLRPGTTSRQREAVTASSRQRA